MPMGQSRIGYTNGVVTEYRSWNPCGFGCSRGCDGCWARAMAHRLKHKCKACAEFRPHFHPERLSQPKETKAPSTVLVQFTGDLFDLQRGYEQIADALDAASDAPQHQYVFLTQQPLRMRQAVASYLHPSLRWFLGATSRTQAEADDRISTLLNLPKAKVWASVEPIQERITVPVRWRARNVPGHLYGIIAGCDRRPKAPWSEGWFTPLVLSAHALCIPIYIKQMRIGTGPTFEGGAPLLHDPKDFPYTLRLRDLPWGPADA